MSRLAFEYPSVVRSNTCIRTHKRYAVDVCTGQGGRAKTAAARQWDGFYNLEVVRSTGGWLPTCMSAEPPPRAPFN